MLRTATSSLLQRVRLLLTAVWDFNVGQRSGAALNNSGTAVEMWGGIRVDLNVRLKQYLGSEKKTLDFTYLSLN